MIFKGLFQSEQSVMHNKLCLKDLENPKQLAYATLLQDLRCTFQDYQDFQNFQDLRLYFLK